MTPPDPSGGHGGADAAIAVSGHGGAAVVDPSVATAALAPPDPSGGHGGVDAAGSLRWPRRRSRD